MDGFSSYDVALKVARARPGREHVDAVMEVFGAIEGDGVESLPEGRRALGRAVLSVVEVTPDADHTALAFGAGFVAAAMDSPGGSIPEGEASLAIVSLSGLARIDPNLEVKAASRAGGYSEDDIPRVAKAIHDATGVPDELVEVLVGSRPSFPLPTPESIAFAEDVIGFSGEGLPEDPRVAKASLAAAAVNIDPSSSDGERIGSALARASTMPDDVSLADMSIALASDLAAQARAMRMLEGKGLDGVPDEQLDVLRSSSLPEARADLEAEAHGRFHELSRGAARDLRMDMSDGANLPPETIGLIRANVARMEEWQASLSSPQVVAETTSRSVPPMPQREALEL